MKDFTIDRLTWYRGKGGVTSRLKLKDSDFKCCVGFQCIAEGMNVEDIEDIETVGKLGDLAPEDLRLVASCTSKKTIGIVLDSAMYTNIYNTNDSTTLTETEREARLAGLFKSIGVIITFEN